MKQETMEATLVGPQMMDKLAFNLTSNKSADSIAAEVEGVCSQNQFSVLTTYNYKEILEKKGFPIERKAYIFEICQAKLASKMLTAYPSFSIFMPCKIALYEEEGKTILSTMNMELMLDMIKDNASLFQEATAMFESIKNIMATLKG